MTPQNPMRRIYQKISQAGFSPAYIKKLLPDWWDDSLANTPSGRQYASLHLARTFNLSLDSLKDDSEDLSFSFGGNHKFKHRNDFGDDDLHVATAIAYTAARIAATNFLKPFEPDLDLRWETVRERILENNKWVSLHNLTEYCHSVGIPVVYIKCFPKGAKKMAGLAVKSAGRPVIVLTQTQKYGFMLFDLAHELGHIARGHLNDDNGQCHIDAKIEISSTDHLEAEANNYAFGVITGQEAMRIQPKGSYLTGPGLARSAVAFGEQRNVDPTHVALNYGFAMGHWGVAVTAVKEICAGRESDQKFMREKLICDLNMDSIDEDDLSILNVLAGE